MHQYCRVLVHEYRGRVWRHQWFGAIPKTEKRPVAWAMKIEAQGTEDDNGGPPVLHPRPQSGCAMPLGDIIVGEAAGENIARNRQARRR